MNTEVAETPAIAGIVTQELKQKQTVLNLDTMEDSEISLIYNKVVPNNEAPIEVQLSAATELVSPVEKRVTALCNFATSENYRAAKEAALATGNYMNSALRSALTGIMGGIAAFSENKAGANFDYWKDAYKDKANPDRQAKAKKLLDRAKLLVDTEEFGSM